MRAVVRLWILFIHLYNAQAPVQDIVHVKSEVGTSVTLPCRVLDDAAGVTWVKRTATSDEIDISISGQVKSGLAHRFSVGATDDGWHNLTIKQLDREDAAYYTCTAHGVSHYVQLKVSSHGGETKECCPETTTSADTGDWISYAIIFHLLCIVMCCNSSTTTPIPEEESRNNPLRAAFRKLNEEVINALNASDVADALFAAGVISTADSMTLNGMTQRTEKTRTLMNLLHTCGHPEAFVILRDKMAAERATHWLVEKIDQLCPVVVIVDLTQVDRHIVPRRAVHLPTTILQLILRKVNIILSNRKIHRKLTGTDAFTLPSELLELIIKKAALRLREWVRVRPCVSLRQADAESLLAVCSVCTEWYLIVVGRKFNLRQLKKHYHMRPQVVGELETTHRVLRGVALLGSRIYVIARRSNNVEVYESTGSFAQHTPIHVRGLKWPRDMVACSARNILYIVDNHRTSNCVWSVDVSSAETVRVSKAIVVDPAEYEPWKVSGNSTQLVVTAWDGRTVHVYDSDYTPLKPVRTPGSADARHAVATPAGTFVIGQIGEPESNAGGDYVSEIASDGTAVRSYSAAAFGGVEHQLRDPYHLALASGGRVLVPDYYNNGRIVLLNEQLQFDRVLLDKKRDELSGEPRRLCYRQQDGHMLVAMTGGKINVYQWK